MSKKLTLGVSPITRTVYAGSLLKCGTVWAANKTDVTQEFMGCIKEYIGINNEMTVTSGGVPQFVVRVLAPDYVPKDERELKQQRDELLSVLKELQESASYWSEYDVPLGIVDRINNAIKNAEAAK